MGLGVPYIVYMDYCRRLHHDRLVRLFEHFPIVAILGARQVGKSTLVKQAFEDRLKTVVFDPVEDVGQARRDPDFFLQNNPPPLFLDEVQYAPELLAALKRKVDRSPGKGQYILSGSQNLSVLKNISESLAGRVAILELLPMSFREWHQETRRPSFLKEWIASSGENPTFEKREAPVQPWFHNIWRGGYPGLLELPEDLIPTYRQSYLQTYIERDVRTAAGVGDLQQFGRFFALLSAYSGQEINAAQLGRELNIDRKTALAWKSVAMATYQWFEIPAFTRNAIKRVSGKNKGYLSDTGFICHQQRIVSADAIAGHPLQGALVESWTVMEILKTLRAWDAQPNIYHYRSHGGAEIDLLLELNGRLFPIEIKSKSHPTRWDAGGMRSLRQSFPQEHVAPGLIVSAVEEPQWITEECLAIPWWSL